MTKKCSGCNCYYNESVEKTAEALISSNFQISSSSNIFSGHNDQIW